MNSKHLTKGDRMPSPVRRGKVRLYSNRFCPYSQRVVLVLDAKKVNYEIFNINLVNKPDWIYNKTPNGQVPALELDSGDVLYDSIIICEFLDLKVAQFPLNSKDALQRAKDQILLKQFTAVINALIKTISLGRVEDDEANEISAGLNVFEQELLNRRGPFFNGVKPGMLDFMIWPWCERSEVLKMFGKEHILKKDKYRKLMKWRQNMIEQEVVKKSCFSTSTHIQYLQSAKAGTPDYDQIIKDLFNK